MARLTKPPKAGDVLKYVEPGLAHGTIIVVKAVSVDYVNGEVLLHESDWDQPELSSRYHDFEPAEPPVPPPPPFESVEKADQWCDRLEEAR
jgi:hypothetical protein